MTIDVDVLIPKDRVAAFQIAMGSFTSGRPLSVPQAGATDSGWVRISVAVASTEVKAFYSAFSDWLASAVAGSPTQADVDDSRFQAIWDDLPSSEQEVLRLLADDSGRAVGWPELRDKLRFPAHPSLDRDLPVLSRACHDAGVRPPVRQDGSGDDAILYLPAAVVTE